MNIINETQALEILGITGGSRSKAALLKLGVEPISSHKRGIREFRFYDASQVEHAKKMLSEKRPQPIEQGSAYLVATQESIDALHKKMDAILKSFGVVV